MIRGIFQNARVLCVALLALSFLLVAGCESSQGTPVAESRPVAETTPASSEARPDADMKSVLDQLAAMAGKPIETLTPEEARKQPTPADAVKALLEKQGKSTAPEPVGKVEERMIAGATGQIPARVYTPDGKGPFPVIVYFHGGGWVIATNDTYDSSARALTNAAQAVLLSVEYRKGPESKFPAAHDDAFAAYKWALTNAKSINGDANNIAVAGESAGGNLAANVSIMARDNKVKMPVHQLLIYPVANNDLNAPSMIENANAKPLNRAMLPWFMGHYLKDPSESSNPMISLVRADLKSLPATTVITAQIDPLQSEGQMLAEKLRGAGVQVESRNYDGVTHEFFGMGAVVSKAKQAVAQAGMSLRTAFSVIALASR